MAKQLPKEGGRKWYTATIAPKEKREGHWDTRSIEVFALDEQAVKDFLTRKGRTWGRITITEGKNMLQAPMNQDAGAERYHVELEAMLGHQLPPRYNSGPFPCGYMNTTQEVKDADARKSWATYLKEWSYGLSVSALPHYLEVDWYGTLYLPARWVQDPKEWHRCTAIVQATVKQCRASRAHMAEHRKGDRSPEGRELRKQDVEAVKSIPALEGWTFPVYVERLLHDYSPSPFDIPNPRLFDIVTGCMVPTFEPDRDYVKVEFWRHLLATWDGPANMRAEVVRSMLDHHHLHSERAEVLRALVKSTATRLRIMQVIRSPRPEHWMALADELEQWIADARKAPTSAKDTGKAKDKPTPPPTLRTMADRLDAKTGAREAFDTMLHIDGYTTEAGEWKLASRKGRAEVVAAWDAVVEIFGVEGYAKEEKSDKALSAALWDYIPGLTISERPNKLRNNSKGSAYAKARASYESYLKERRKLIIAERSDTSK